MHIILEISRPIQWKPGAPLKNKNASKTILYNIQDSFKAPTGTSRQAGLRRLRKDRPDLLQQVLDKGLTVNEAMTIPKPRAQRIAQRAAELLASGVLASALPGRLMEEFGLTPAQARRAAVDNVNR